MRFELKKAFSLAEILIALAIISVISVMGFSISQKGLADAYQGYFFTGYQAMDATLKDAQSIFFPPDNVTNNLGSFLTHIEMSLSLDETPTANKKCTAPNGIIYEFTKIINNGTKAPTIEMTMQVPSIKTDKINKDYRYVKLKYDSEKPYLEPLIANNNEIKDGYVDLRERIDLIAFIVDDGTGGAKSIIEGDDENGYTVKTIPPEPIKYSNYKDAMSKYTNEQYNILLVNPRRAYNN